jgi:hypothetical protein
MPKSIEYRFTIDGYTPDTLPTARLAEYLADLADMLGQPSKVHFVKIEDGSAVLINKVEQAAIPEVEKQLTNISKGEAPQTAMRAYRQINDKLKSDNSVGVLARERGATIIKFPGRETKEAVSYGPFRQDGSLDGEVIMVGGSSDPVPVHLQQGSQTYNCLAKRDLAKVIGAYLFSTQIRVFGSGRWYLNNVGDWELRKFVIDRFDVLDDVGLRETIDSLREVPGSGWKDVKDPWGELLSMREDSSENH